VTVTTDKSSYLVGETVTICIEVNTPGTIRVVNVTPDGRQTEIRSASLDGRGCITATAAPPTGRECIRVEFTAAGGRTSAETCFNVQPMSSGATAAGATTCNWAGTWRSRNDPDLVLTQTGSQVSGTFGFRGQVRGTVSGDTLTATATDTRGTVTQLRFRMNTLIDVFSGQQRSAATTNCQVMSGFVGNLPKEFTK
jgi:hypothetical protein